MSACHLLSRGASEAVEMIGLTNNALIHSHKVTQSRTLLLGQVNEI